MSRIGKLPVSVPDGVSVVIDKNVVSVKGPKGELSRSIDSAVSISCDEGLVTVALNEDTHHARAMTGTARSLIASMVKGVVEGFVKNLEISGVGFRAMVSGSLLDLNLGFSHDIKYPIPEGISITVTENTKLKVEGMDKQVVGQVAADIKRYFPAEPYKGKGVRIVGEFVRRKQGKKSS